MVLVLFLPQLPACTRMALETLYFSFYPLFFFPSSLSVPGGKALETLVFYFSSTLPAPYPSPEQPWSKIDHQSRTHIWLETTRKRSEWLSTHIRNNSSKAPGPDMTQHVMLGPAVYCCLTVRFGPFWFCFLVLDASDFPDRSLTSWVPWLRATVPSLSVTSNAPLTLKCYTCMRGRPAG